MQISLGLAPMETAQPELPGQILPELEHKQPRQVSANLGLISRVQLGSSEDGTHICIYLPPLRCLTEKRTQVMSGSLELISATGTYPGHILVHPSFAYHTTSDRKQPYAVSAAQAGRFLLE